MRGLLLLLRLLLLSLLLHLSSPSPVLAGKKSRGTNGVEDILRREEILRASPSVQLAAAQGVLRRLLPSHTSSFLLKVVPKGLCERFSCFRIGNVVNSTTNGPEIMIEGTTAVEISSGLHWYLKYWCGAHFSWDKTGGVQMATVPSPGSLPLVEGQGVKVERPVPWNYYQNVVTLSYSFAWWDWKRWEKEIDWMALQGINLPLAFTGQEAIWQKVFKDFDVSNKDLGNFFGGPAFLAWARMGNLHGWGGPLSQDWLDQQLSLQKLILHRMIELGMTPVLPAFSGNVPAIFRTMFPAANITRLSDWNTVNGDPRWCCTYLLDPSDPLFIEVGRAFIKQQIKEYGRITNIYSCDTFNENLPPTNDPKYISSLGAAVYDAMAEGDSDAIWLMQGWLFSSDAGFWKPPQMKALLHSVPIGKMIILDLFADVKPIWKISSQFYGVPYVWCMLHNFGGNIEMYGILDEISSGPIEARVSPNSTMVGVGMCMEGIEHNPVVYELMPEMAFRSHRFQIEGWLKNYSFRRYGQANHHIEEAWKILYHTLYNCTDGIADHNKDFLVQFPDLSPSQEGSQVLDISKNMNRRFLFSETISNSQGPHLWYSTKEVIAALELFIVAGSSLTESLTYRYDLVDLTRQVLAKYSNQVYLDAMNAFHQNDAGELVLQIRKFSELIEDIDTLLASDDNFLLGTWLESAKKLAVNEKERRQYEWNARTQITMWFDTTETNQSQLHDYANKFWSGLLKSYYLPRASTYFSYLLQSLNSKEDFPLEKWRRDWISYSNKWQEGQELYPVEAEVAGGSLDSDRIISNDDSTPIVIVVPGLTSDSSSSYVKHIAYKMAKHGWNVVVENHRGLGGVSITSDCFYNAGWTQDVREVVNHLHQKYSTAPLFAVGTSIGANILIKYLGEEGEKTPVAGAASICSTWDLLVCDRFINRKLIQRLYNRALTIGLKGYAQLHKPVMARLANWDGIRKSRSVRDFDNHSTCLVGKFETVDTYYRRCSSVNYVGSVSVPLLCINALDDPVCTEEAIPWDECRANKNIVLATTSHGGHLAYFQGVTASSVWWVSAVDEFLSVLHSGPYMHAQKQMEGRDLHPPPDSSIDRSPYINFTEDGLVAAMVSDENEAVAAADDDRTNGAVNASPLISLPSGQKEDDDAGASIDIKDAASASIKRRLKQLSRQSRISMWLLVYMAIASSWPLVGSSLLFLFRNKLKGVFPGSAAAARRR